MSDSIDAMFESNDRLRYEEKVMLFCLLKDVKLVKRNSKMIKDYMFRLMVMSRSILSTMWCCVPVRSHCARCMTS